MKPIIAGNWKMNTNLTETQSLINGLQEKPTILDKVTCIICPPFTNLESAKKTIKNGNIKLGAQNVSPHNSGAYTGEISINMLKDVQCNYVIIGHSERREYFNETNLLVNEKLIQTLKNGLIPILCVGETLEQRESNKAFDVISTQLKESLINTKPLIEKSTLIVAYEPVWAIGTGKVATPEQAQEIHAHIYVTLKQLLGEEITNRTAILYGGSVKPDNINELIKQKNISGALVGGASLAASDFLKIMENSVS